MPAQLGATPFIAPHQIGLAHLARLQGINQAIRHVLPGICPKQFFLFKQHLQQDRADLALGLGGAAVLGTGAAAHGNEETHQVLVLAFQIGRRGGQERKNFIDRAGGGHLPVRAQARLAQTQGDMAPARGRGEYVHELVLRDLGIFNFSSQFRLWMRGRVNSGQPGCDRRRQAVCRRADGSGSGCGWCFTGVVAHKFHRMHLS